MPRVSRQLGRYSAVILLICSGQFLCAEEPSARWSQFRGPNASGVVENGGRLPDEIGPEQHVVWKKELPPGHSSPAVVGDRIYLTAVTGTKLQTLALDRPTGEILWQREVTCETLEEIHRIGSHAQASPAADEDLVISFFGSYGLLAYDREGTRLWERRLGPFKNNFGAGSSPILAGDWVILNQDHDIDSFLTAIDKRTGDTIWKTERAEFARGYSTPILWNNQGQRQIVVAGSLRVVGYDLKSGNEAWTVHGLSRICNMTPVEGSDGTLYVAGWTSGGDDTDRIVADPLEELLANSDANKDGLLQRDELPEGGGVKRRFNQIDRDKSGAITPAEYNWMRNIFHSAQNAVVAIRPGGSGDITASHVLWTERKHLPYVPSPVYYNQHLYMVKNGGIVACLDAATGDVARVGRAKASGQYYSSPVIADGKLFVISQRGELTVMTAEPNWEILSTAVFGEDIYATPAIVDDRIYLRTHSQLYCFGLE